MTKVRENVFLFPKINGLGPVNYLFEPAFSNLRSKGVRLDALRGKKNELTSIIT